MNYKNLVYFTITKVLNQQQVCWSEELLNFNFKIYYWKESENAKTDVLSRRSDYMKNKFQTTKLILLLQQNEQITYNTRIITAILLISNNKLEEVIQYRYFKDKQASKEVKKSTMSFKKISNELILFKELVYISEYQQKQIIKMYYNNSLKKHCETHKMIKAISQSYYFLHIWRKITDYVSKCDLCHKIKSSRHKSYEEIKTTLILNWL